MVSSFLFALFYLVFCFVLFFFFFWPGRKKGAVCCSASPKEAEMSRAALFCRTSVLMVVDDQEGAKNQEQNRLVDNFHAPAWLRSALFTVAIRPFRQIQCQHYPRSRMCGRSTLESHVAPVFRSPGRGVDESSILTVQRRALVVPANAISGKRSRDSATSTLSGSLPCRGKKSVGLRISVLHFHGNTVKALSVDRVMPLVDSTESKA